MCLSTSKRSTPAEVVLRLLVLKHMRNWSYGVLHPLFVQILDFLGNQPVTKGALRPPCLDHGFFLARRGAIRPQQRVVELAAVLERFLELVVIAEPPAHLINLFAAQAELASPAAGIADGQNPQRVPAAAGADRAAAGVAHGPLEQRAAQNLPCHRQLGDERLARLDNLVSRHLYK